MYVQVINFNLEGMTEEEWHAAGRRLLEDYSQTPGLLAKVWIGNAETTPWVESIFGRTKRRWMTSTRARWGSGS